LQCVIVIESVLGQCILSGRSMVWYLWRSLGIWHL